MNDLDNVDDLDDLDRKIFNISWEHITTCRDMICKEVKKLDTNPVAVIAKQADAVLSSMVANELGLPLGITQLRETPTYGVHLECTPKVHASIRSGEYYQPRHTVLLIATLIDDNSNINDLVAYYKARGNDVVVMAAYSRKKVDMPPDFAASLVTSLTNCRFPWK
jgi:hypothetical protein